MQYLSRQRSKYTHMLLLVAFTIVVLSGSAWASTIRINEVIHGEKPAHLLVEPENGRWTHVNRNFPFRYNFRVKAKVKGPLIGAKGINKVVVRERGNGGATLWFGSNHPPTRSVNKLAAINEKASKISEAERTRAVALCNSLLSKGGAPDKVHTLTDAFNLPVRVVVDGILHARFTDFNEHGDTVNWAAHKNRVIPVTVICQKQAGYVRPHKNASIQSVSLKYKVISEGNTCPSKVRRTITVRGTRSGIFRVHLRGGGKKLGEFTVTVKKDGSQFIGRRVDEINMASTDEVHRLVVPNTDIKSKKAALKVTCGRPEIVSIKLNVKNLNIAGADSCPMKVRVTAVYETTRPGQFLGVLKRSGVEAEGKEWVESLTAKEKDGRYIAKIVKVENFEDDFVYPVKYRAIAPGKPALNTNWKDADVRCPFKVKAAVLSYKQEDKLTCPKEVITKVKFPTTAPGKVRFRFKSAAGNLSNWFTVKAKLEGDKYVARYRGATTYEQSVNATMTAIAAGPPSVKSSPVTLNVMCGVRGN